MAFTPDQRAQGILRTISNGDWSLAAARLEECPVTERWKVSKIVKLALTRDELKIWERYYKR